MDIQNFRSQFNNAEAMLSIQRNMAITIAQPFERVMCQHLKDVVDMLVYLTNDQLIQFYIESCL